MGYGLLINNTSGQMVIDSDEAGRQSYQQVAKGRVTTLSASYTSSGVYYYDKAYGQGYVDLPSSVGEKLVFVRPTTATNVKFYGVYSSSTRFYIYAYRDDSTLTGVEFDYIVFQKASRISSANNYGLEIYNTNNEIVFSSNSLSGRLRAVLSPGATYEEEGSMLLLAGYNTKKLMRLAPTPGGNYWQMETYAQVGYVDSNGVLGSANDVIKAVSYSSSQEEYTFSLNYTPRYLVINDGGTTFP